MTRRMLRRVAVAAALGSLLAGCCPSPMGTRDSSDAAPGVQPPADEAPVVAVMRGRASYYADSLAGNHTANGEVYDPAELTAASRTLPFGTYVRVTRLDNGRSVVVRVNDRGPFGRRRRILDLSRAAAEQLEMIAAGVVKVKAEVLERR